MTLDQKTVIINRIAGMPRDSVTLDGRPALICAFASPFLTVVTQGNPRVSAEFSWQTVERILNQGAAFRSF